MDGHTPTVGDAARELDVAPEGYAGQAAWAYLCVLAGRSLVRSLVE